MNAGKSVLALATAILAVTAVAVIAFRTGQRTSEPSIPASTPYPTYTPAPTATPWPTYTPFPTPTTVPTATQGPAEVMREALLAEGFPPSSFACEYYQDPEWIVQVSVCGNRGPGTFALNNLTVSTCLQEACLQTAETLIPRVWAAIVPRSVADWFAQVDLRHPPRTRSAYIEGYELSVELDTDPQGGRWLNETATQGQFPPP